MRTSIGERIAAYGILLVFAAITVVPLVNVITAALGPQSLMEPGGLHPENFAAAWQQGRFGAYMLTSVLVVAIVVPVALVLSVLAGYAFGTMRFRGDQVLFYLFLVGIMVPAEAIVVPLFFDLRTLGLTNTLWAVALPQIAQSVAFGTFWMRTYFRTSNRSMVEAAALDGAGPLRVLFSILVPIGRPAITTLIILTFMWTWNEFLIPLVMSPNGSLRTAPLALALFKGQHTEATALLAAAAILVALPVLVVYVFAQRHFIRGMIDGAVRD